MRVPSPGAEVILIRPPAAECIRLATTSISPPLGLAYIAGALEAALKLGRPGFGAVDVFEDEPVLGGIHPLLKLDNCICTPHIGYVEHNGYEGQFTSSFGQIIAYLEGKPINVINPDALEKAWH